MKNKWIFVIFLVGAILRLAFLSTFPPGFTPDEASFGYDAYSILKTGKDQWGQTFPLVLESFGDFKPPLFAYILIPFVAILGLTEWVIRLPNALLGSLSVFVVYSLTIELKKLWSEKINLESGIWNLELIAALLLAISPWHVTMSRGGFEANLTTFLLPLGIFLFLKGLRTKKNKLLYWSSFVFGLNLFSYHSAKIVTPLIFFFLLLIFGKELLKSSRKVIIGFVGIFSVFLILTGYTFYAGAGTRVADISIYSGAMEAAAIPRLEAIDGGMSVGLAKVLHNKYTVSATRFINNYKQYFSYKFLFSEGPAEATYGMIPGTGVLYLIELPLLIGFLITLWKYRNDRALWLIAFWLMVAPIPAALATGPGYAGNRSVIGLPAMQIALAVGGLYLFRILGKRKVFAYIFLLILFTSSSFRFFEHYLFSRQVGAKAMLYGRREMVEYLIENDYDPMNSSVVIDKRLSEPQIHVAFYMQLDPDQYQDWARGWGIYRRKNVNFIDQLDEYEMGRFLFTTNFIEKTERFADKDLLVGKPEEFSEDVVPEKIIYYPGFKDSEPAIYIVKPSGTK